ncbi:MAG: HEAT repeat domain-containing protein [Candidatus Binatus sp.]|uniref:HEAT repeat domain-containing protein n=1 Tax=Candidatus Binatus sp. TaxID=2811406 RepID=UPI003C74E7D0
MRKILWVIPCLALCCVFAASLWAAQPDLGAADWSVKSPYSLATNPPSHEAVLALLNKMYTDVYSGICSYHFVDLRHSGNLSLVVSGSDGRFCALSIIDKTPSGFELYGVDIAQYSRGAEIEDLAGNGNLELIVDTDFTGYRGLGDSHCIATWPVIYAWTGSGYTDVSSQYKGYYEQQLESLKKQIAAISSATEEAQSPAAARTPGSAAPRIPVLIARMSTTESSSGSSNGGGAAQFVPAPETSSSPAATPAATPYDLVHADCTEAEAAKIERFLGVDKDAGMADAIKWANSDDTNTREFAADALTDIGTPDAIEYLRTLSNDSDGTVAGIAKNNLEAVGRGPVLHTVTRQ